MEEGSTQQIGGLKIEHDKKLFGDRLIMIENEKQSFPQTKVTTLEAKNEYDKEELGNLNQTHNRILYLAKDAGCGKSTASCCGVQKDDIIFVSPFNAQCIELKKDGYDAITINKFFARGIGDINLGKSYDWSSKKLIIFDEILLNNIYLLNMIRNFVEKHSQEITIIANGDVNQLKPINLGINNVRTKHRTEWIAFKVSSQPSLF